MTPCIDPAPGRHSIPLTPRWTAVVLRPMRELPGLAVVGLLLDGEPVEVIDEPDDVHTYLRALKRVFVNL